MLGLFNLSKKPNASFFGASFDSKSLALILFKEGYPLCWAREPLTGGVVLDGRVGDKEQFTQALLVCRDRCLNEQGSEQPRDVFFGVGGTSILSSLVTARQKRDDVDWQVTKKAVTDMYTEINQSGLDDASQEIYQTTGDREADLENVLSETMSITLDGVVTFDPIGREGRVLEVTSFNAYCSPAYLDLFEDVTKSLKQDLGGVYPLQFLLSRKLKGKLGDHYDGTLLTVHESYTDISIVFGGDLIRNKTLPLGANEIEKDLDVWMDGLELALLDFSGVKTYANNVYVCGLGLERTDFWEMLEWREWEEKIPFKMKPVFTKLDASYLDLPQDYKGELLICGLLSICKELV